jgi:hypothetical protein
MAGADLERRLPASKLEEEEGFIFSKGRQRNMRGIFL